MAELSSEGERIVNFSGKLSELGRETEELVEKNYLAFIKIVLGIVSLMGVPEVCLARHSVPWHNLGRVSQVTVAISKIKEESFL